MFMAIINVLSRIEIQIMSVHARVPSYPVLWLITEDYNLYGTFEVT